MRRSRIMVQNGNTNTMEFLPCFERNGSLIAVRNGTEYEIQFGSIKI